MKVSIIKKLERAVLYYQQVERCLEKASDMAYKEPTEYFRFLDGRSEPTYRLINEMWGDAISERKHIEGKIRAFKELSNNE